MNIALFVFFLTVNKRNLILEKQGWIKAPRDTCARKGQGVRLANRARKI